MTADPRPLEDRIIDRVVWGEEIAECAECAAITAELERDPTWEMAAAAFTAAHLANSVQRPPPGLLGKLEADAAGHLVRRHGLSLERVRPLLDDAAPAVEAGREPSRAAAGGGWGRSVLLAAALIVAAVLGWQAYGPSPSPERQRERLMASADALRLDIDPGTSERRGDPDGDVVWSSSRQQGFLRLSGLPGNDAAREQYQLWIVDPGRPGSAPIDGGLFDVPSGAREVVVPFDADVRVRAAPKFVITLEEAGGVVVSGQEHVIATAGIR